VGANGFEPGAVSSAAIDLTRLLQSAQIAYDSTQNQKKEEKSSDTQGDSEVEAAAAINAPAKLVYDPYAKNADENGTSVVSKAEVAKEAETTKKSAKSQVVTYDAKAKAKPVKTPESTPDTLLDIKL